MSVPHVPYRHHAIVLGAFNRTLVSGTRWCASPTMPILGLIAADRGQRLVFLPWVSTAIIQSLGFSLIEQDRAASIAYTTVAPTSESQRLPFDWIEC